MNEDPTPSMSPEALGNLAPIHFFEVPKLCITLSLHTCHSFYLRHNSLHPTLFTQLICTHHWNLKCVTTSPGKSSLSSSTGRLSYSMLSPLVMVCNNMLQWNVHFPEYISNPPEGRSLCLLGSPSHPSRMHHIIGSEWVREGEQVPWHF